MHAHVHLRVGTQNNHTHTLRLLVRMRRTLYRKTVHGVSEKYLKIRERSE